MLFCAFIATFLLSAVFAAPITSTANLRTRTNPQDSINGHEWGFIPSTQEGSSDGSEWSRRDAVFSPQDSTANLRTRTNPQDSINGNEWGSIPSTQEGSSDGSEWSRRDSVSSPQDSSDGSEWGKRGEISGGKVKRGDEEAQQLYDSGRTGFVAEVRSAEPTTNRLCSSWDCSGKRSVETILIERTIKEREASHGCVNCLKENLNKRGGVKRDPVPHPKGPKDCSNCG